ncbi:MAG: RecX family transcriptional regulator [Bacteroidota bacterium]
MVRFCNYRDRCSSEVLLKIKEIDPENKYGTYLFENLKAGEYFSDSDFANSFASGKFRIKHWGKSKIKSHLQAKNIAPDTIDRALKQIDESDYRRKAKELILQKTRTRKLDFILKQKILRSLFQKGYESSLVLDLFSDLEKAQND